MNRNGNALSLWPVLALVALVLALATPAAAAPPPVRVALSTGAGGAAVMSWGGFEVYDAGGHPLLSAAAGMPVSFSVFGGQVQVEGIGSAGSVAVLQPAAGSYLQLDGQRSYRGYMRVEAVGDTLLVVNVVGMEEYLYGVVPREMPALWHMEALRAQAVAARTYALRNVLLSGGARYDVVSTQLNQVYGGLRDEHPRSSEAVDTTAGQVLLHGGQPILAAYHSSSGGHTEHVENVWTQPLPYLRGVPDVDHASPYYSWSVVYTFQGIKTYLDRAGLGVGEVYGLEPAPERGVSGRVLAVTVRGSERQRIIAAGQFRRVVGLRSTLFELELGAAGSGDGDLRTATRDEYVMIVGADTMDERRLTLNVAVGAAGQATRVLDAAIIGATPGAPTVLRFTGGGWGHGVGMSQYGARQLAEDGHLYGQILSYYYQGVQLAGDYGR